MMRAGWTLVVLCAALGCGDPSSGSPDHVEDVEVNSDTSPEVEDVADVAEDVAGETGAPDTSEPGDAPDTSPDTLEPTPLVLNEHDCRDEWVELVNLGAAPLDLSAWTLSDGPDGNRMALSGTLAPGARLVVTLEGFGLACGAEGPALFRGATLVDQAPPGDAPAGYTYGRFPDATGAFTVTAPTRGAVNRLPDEDPFDPAASLFGPLRPLARVELTLPEASVASLWGDPYVWVPATFAWVEGAVREEHPVAVRIKGRIGSLRDLSGKAAFKLDFARFWPDGQFRGLEEMTLNNMVQDFNRVNEVLAYDLFARMGVPVPRQSYVWLVVNGEPFGLYLNLEALDGRWRDRHFESTRGFFEGQYGEDLVAGSAFRFDLDGGDESARLDLDALVTAIAEAPREGFMEALSDRVVWDEVLAMMATEVFIGHWDGYGPTRNNYFLHVDELGRLRMVPWGLDQTFGADLGLFEGQGLLLQGCVNDPPCRRRWEDELARLASIVTAPGYIGWADALADRLQPHIDAEPREDGGDARSGLDNAWGFLAHRAGRVAEVLACTRDPLADQDGDGHVCDQDCAEGDPDRYVGAVEACGDGVDQDCNGRPDDGPDCPDCTTATFEGSPEVYRFCWRERTFFEANDLCTAEGGHLVVFESNDEQARVAAEMDRRGLGTAWIGLSDLEEEGVFRWVTGAIWEPGVGGFMDNQPDDWLGGEDCVQIHPWAGERPWNDLFCDSAIPVICELATP